MLPRTKSFILDGTLCAAMYIPIHHARYSQLWNQSRLLGPWCSKNSQNASSISLSICNIAEQVFGASPSRCVTLWIYVRYQRQLRIKIIVSHSSRPHAALSTKYRGRIHCWCLDPHRRNGLGTTGNVVSQTAKIFIWELLHALVPPGIATNPTAKCASLDATLRWHKVFSHTFFKLYHRYGHAEYQ